MVNREDKITHLAMELLLRGRNPRQAFAEAGAFIEIAEARKVDQSQHQHTLRAGDTLAFDSGNEVEDFGTVISVRLGAVRYKPADPASNTAESHECLVEVVTSNARVSPARRKRQGPR